MTSLLSETLTSILLNKAQAVEVIIAITLLVLFVQKEWVIGSRDTTWEALRKTLNVGIVPLLVVFGVLILNRIV